MIGLRRLCVFCGSSPGADRAYVEAARALGALLAEQRIGLVYGGASVGLMGELADAALRAGGEVIGVIPRHLDTREVAHRGLTELRVVASMHERKALMADLADAFLALPRGLGTLEELFEAATWSQLGIHQKPLGLLNVRGYFDLIARFLEHAVQQRFVRPEHASLLMIGDDARALLDRLRAFEPPVVPKWLDRSER